MHSALPSVCHSPSATLFSPAPNNRIKPNIMTNGIVANKYLKSEAMLVGRKDPYIKTVASAITPPIALTGPGEILSAPTATITISDNIQKA